MNQGLHTSEAEKRLKQYGYNELPSAKSKSVFQIALEVFKEPMFILLITCGTLYLLLGDYTEGIMLMSSVLLIIFITFYQHQRSEKAIHALKDLSSPRALVIREGKEMRIAGREVVPGDLILLHEGDRIPADGELVENNNLVVDESLLTGESVPVRKIPGEAPPKVFSGSLVVQGHALMETQKTGIHTELGKIGKALTTIESGHTRLQIEMKTLIRNLFIISAVLSALVIVAYYLSRGNLLTSFLNGLAASMAMLPEEFPVVMTVFLAMGAWRLSKKNVLTRKPTAIETLGSATVLCSDKTGTITENKMSIASLYIDGQLIKSNEFSAKSEQQKELLTIASFTSPPESIDPMEIAIQDTLSNQFRQEFTFDILKEYPLTHDFFATSAIVKTSDDQLMVGCKGAPELILTLCSINESDQATYLETIQNMAEAGQRILGVAKSRCNDASFPAEQQDFRFEFLGFIGFQDPVKKEVPAAVQECYTAGIKVVMITGDYPSTAKSIALQAGMDAGEKVMTGNELDNISDEELAICINDINVFARIVPEQKLRIIKAFQANGDVVAMTGDGVNDAPALKAADIGVAMGNKGTDVAREAASLVLVDDNFSSIVAAIRSGRRIYDNLQKAMGYIIAIHIPIIGLTLLPAFFSELPILMMPLHIVLLELIIDPVCSIAFESEQEEMGIMERPPRNPSHRFFGLRRIFKSSIVGILLFGIVLGIYFLSISEGHSDGEIRAIAFSSLVLGNLFVILSMLSKSRYIPSILLEKNIALYTIFFLASSILVTLIAIPALRDIFSFDYPGFSHFWIVFVACFGLVTGLELYKLYRNKKK